MSKYHKDSEECGLVNFDLATPPKTCTSIRNVLYTEIPTINSIADNSGPLEFFIPGSPKLYIDLSRTLLYLKCQILKKDGSMIEPEAQVGLTNLTAHAIFQQVDVLLNEKLVTNACNLYHYRAMIETLLNYGAGAKQTWLTSAMFYPDDSEGIDSLKTDGSGSGAQDGNAGLYSRHEISKNSKIFDMIGRLHVDLFQQNRPIIPNVDIRIKISRNSPEFIIITALKDDYQFKIHEATLLVRSIEPSDNVILEHATAMERGITMKYPLHRCEVTSYSIAQGVMNHTRAAAVTGQLPVRVVIGIVRNDALNGQYNLNGFDFSPNFLNE